MPLGTGRQVTGALTLVRTDPARPFDTGDPDVASNIGRRVGPVFDNARRREVAEAMQRNLLPALPEHGRIQLAARYQPAPAGSQVGGDWYDAFPLRDGALALVIGDVVGHDLTAAAGMAQSHGILRSSPGTAPGRPVPSWTASTKPCTPSRPCRWPPSSSPGGKARAPAPGRFAGPVPGTCLPCC
ncbi:SpoIIE family protein phosphatase [Streptomyces sp. NPDC001792]|uniref:PP2C family protein-serine/threonine phosphatase n=1 Tax=Streptomyces sp. NPDC001792 TaxID=3154524 RepID=UPI0033206F71